MSGWDWAWATLGLSVLASAIYLTASILGARRRDKRRTRYEDQAIALTKNPRPAPGPRLLMTSNFYSDGTTIVHDHQRRRSHRFGPGAEDFDDIDRALREELGL